MAHHKRGRAKHRRGCCGGKLLKQMPKLTKIRGLRVRRKLHTLD